MDLLKVRGETDNVRVFEIVIKSRSLCGWRKNGVSETRMIRKMDLTRRGTSYVPTEKE